MRWLLTVAAILSAIPASRAAVPSFPDFDIGKVCRAQADYAFAATLGQADVDLELAACTDHERENRTLAQTLWLRASGRDAMECLGLADGRYGYLARCLDGSRSIRTAR